MCPIRKRAKSWIAQHSSNPVITIPKKFEQAFQAQQQNQTLQFDSFLLNPKIKPILPINRQAWTTFYLTMQPHIQLAQNLTNSSIPSSTNIEYSQVHSIQLEQQCELCELKTTVSMEVEGSTYGNSSIKEEILSICNSMISVSVEL